MKLSHFTRSMLAASMLLAFALPSSAAVINGADYAGANLSLQDGDVISGVFTNVGSFIIPSAATIYIAGGSPLAVSAQRIDISGILSGRGAGYAGGANGHDGSAGVGPGAGAGGQFGGSVHASGGGGGGSGGAGGYGGSSFGSFPGIAPGGVANAAMMGSGGGGAGNHDCCGYGTGGAGGAGGGSITLNAFNALFLTGSILADGKQGFQGIPGQCPASGGGGGAGGTVNLSGRLFLDGLIDASGGNGGSYIGQSCGSAWGNGGGGGGGGHILLSGTANLGANFLMDVSGGAAGASLNLDGNSPRASAVNATAGAGGVVVNNTQPMADVPEPASAALLALGVLGFVSTRRKFGKQVGK
jgi:hypothetical protein